MPRSFVAVVHAAAVSLALASVSFAHKAQIGQIPHNLQNMVSVNLQGSEAGSSGLYTCGEDPPVRDLLLGKHSPDKCVCVTSPYPSDE